MQVFDLTGAGTGPCGGSCRPHILKMLAAVDPKKKAPPTAELPPEVIEAISLFNRRYYWETHEVLEKIWMDEVGDTKRFYQGFIQAAAALYHVLNSNPKGMIRLGEEALNKLRPYLPIYMGIPLEDLCQKLEAYVDDAKQILGSTRTGFNYDALPYILLGKEMEVPTAFKPEEPKDS